MGANYSEANNASSRRDFKNKIFNWLRMIVRTNPETTEKARVLWQEAHELSLIFSKIIWSMEQKDHEDKIKNSKIK